MTTRRTKTIRWTTAATAGLGAIGLLAAPVSAAPGDVVVAVDQIATGSPGDVVTLTTRDVDDRFVGMTCAGTYEGMNNSSIHPGNDLILSSNGNSVTLTGVEDSAGKVTAASGPLTLGDTITVSVRLGQDGFASLGAALSLDCAQATPVSIETTTTAAAAVVETTTTVVESGGPVPTPPASVLSGGATGSRPAQPAAAADGALPTTGPSDSTVSLLGAAGAMIAAGLGVRRISLRRATRDGAR